MFSVNFRLLMKVLGVCPKMPEHADTVFCLYSLSAFEPDLWCLFAFLLAIYPNLILQVIKISSFLGQ